MIASHTVAAHTAAHHRTLSHTTARLTAVSSTAASTQNRMLALVPHDSDMPLQRSMAVRLLAGWKWCWPQTSG